ncbi:MAG: FKBP-type peptidyl-prolyl cis-trans isomerase [bacterium]|nr:FKBP-type peptidyl-prolyl cis-trans isomerase [bacterium]
MDTKIIVVTMGVALVLVAAVFMFLNRKEDQKNLPLQASQGQVLSESVAQSNDTEDLEHGMVYDTSGEPVQKEGVLIQVVQEGKEGEKVASLGDKVFVHYTGMFEDGTVFDSSRNRGEPFSFTLGAGQVIQGWEIGIEGMKVGEKRMLFIPPELAYGEMGRPGAIPPNATLIFETELVSIGSGN